MLDNKLSVGSLSLGRHASHTLPQKIVAAAETGFSGIEIVYTDLESYAQSVSLSMIEGAREIRRLCKSHNLYILSLAALENFEGVLSPPNERIEKAATWIEIARALGAEHLQVPSTYDRQIIKDPQVIVSELRQLSDLAAAAEPVIKVAYENLSWSSHCTTWQEALQIVRSVDRPNFGLCIDNFHIITGVWGDPFTLSGRRDSADEQLGSCLQDFTTQCPVEKIFYIQLSDGERFDPPYSEQHPWYDSSLEPAHVWSNEARPFPMETDYGAYMPVIETARAFILDTKFTGWVSLETFDRRMRKQSESPARNASRGMKAWKKLQQALESNSSRL